MRRGSRESRLATVLFTDIVGSSEIASDLGDRRYRVLIARHHALVRRELKRFRGREIDTAGDGFFAAFDAPAKGVRCASAISDGVRRLGIEIRAGLHVGEAEVLGRKLGGTAVHIAARVMGSAGPGDVLVTGTLRDLTPGSGFAFSHRGRHSLKGVPGEWDLYAVTALDGQERDGPADPAEAAAIREAIQPPPLLQRRGGRVALGAALLAAAVAIPVVALSTRGGQGAAPSLAGVDRLVRIDPGTGKLAGAIRIGRNPEGVAVTEGVVWVTISGNDTVSRIDPGLNRVDRTIQVGKGPAGVAAGSATEGGADRVWVANTGNTTVSTIDPRTGNAITIDITAGRKAPAPLPPSVSGGIVLGEGAVWIRGDEGNMTRLDPVTGEQTAFVAHTLSDRAFAAGEGAFWAGGDSLQRFDPKRPTEPVAEVHLPEASGAPTGVAVGGGSVWVCTTGGNLLRIDPTTNQVVGSPISVGLRPTGIAVGQGSVWVTSGDGTIQRIFMGGSVVATTIPVGRNITGISVGAGGIWVTVDAP
jgi:YVTN family beta-propeller protein